MIEVVPQSHSSVNVGELATLTGKNITISGAIHRVRKMGRLLFLVIRDGRNLIQCTLEKNTIGIDPESYKEGNYVLITGTCQLDERAPNGVEILVKSIRMLSRPAAQMPVSINHRDFEAGLDTNLDFRPISLRHPKQQAIFTIQSALGHLFRNALWEIGFTEIHTPKLVFAGAEGGANVFRVRYFDKEVFLAQSPQFYKQMMVGVFGRVFEVGPVFRAEPHETARHLNEYTSMDLEMGPIEKFQDIMEVETWVLRYMFEHLKTICAKEIELLEITVPTIDSIPALGMGEAIEYLKDKHPIGEDDDLDGASEQLLCEHAKKEFGSDFLFVTHYPTSKRPVYAMENSYDSSVTESFDLLFRGLEVTTGGQRIHGYSEQVEKLRRLGYDPNQFESYLQIHKYGMPPHGGLGIGLERLTKQLIRLDSIKETCLFPRTMSRITP